jgi:hypothetical protein
MDELYSHKGIYQVEKERKLHVLSSVTEVDSLIPEYRGDKTPVELFCILCSEMRGRSGHLALLGFFSDRSRTIWDGTALFTPR